MPRNTHSFWKKRSLTGHSEPRKRGSEWVARHVTKQSQGHADTNVSCGAHITFTSNCTISRDLRLLTPIIGDTDSSLRQAFLAFSSLSLLPFHRFSYLLFFLPSTDLPCYCRFLEKRFILIMYNWFFMTPSIPTKFQYVNSLLFSFLTHYMFRPLRAIFSWDIQLDILMDYF
jgi:hypothetical protein